MLAWLERLKDNEAARQRVFYLIRELLRAMLTADPIFGPGLIESNPAWLLHRRLDASELAYQS